MRTIPLTNGGECMVSDEDYETLAAFRWQRHPEGYIYRSTRKRPAPPVAHWMHRIIAEAPKGINVDHIDRNPSNNQRTNLRLCTTGQNGANSPAQPRQGRTSQFRGVTNWGGGGWRARYAGVHLGSFTTELQAAAAVDRAHLARYGEFALLNIQKRDDRMAEVFEQLDGEKKT